MRKHGLIIGLAFIAFAAFAAFAGWAAFEGTRIGGRWRSLGPIWPYVAGGAALVGLLAAFLMWLAFYSANHGYDEPTRIGDPGEGAEPATDRRSTPR